MWNRVYLENPFYEGQTKEVFRLLDLSFTPMNQYIMTTHILSHNDSTCQGLDCIRQ